MKITSWLLLVFVGLYLQAQTTPRLLILTTQDFSLSAYAIQQYKETYGIQTQILWAESVNAFPSPEELRDAIRSRQTSFAFDHLLILGDAQHIPPFSGIQGTLHDHGYTLQDQVDYLPDWAVGRLPFPSDQSALRWWQSQIAKRQGLYDGSTALVSVSALNRDDAEGLQISDTLTHRGLSVDLYRQTQQTNDGQDILEHLQQGQAWAIYYGHGDAVGWNSLQPGISSASLEKVALEHPTMVLSAACDNANFAYPQGASLGESFLSAGAMGFVGCTGQCLYDYSDTVTKYTLFRYLEAEYRTIGEALRLAKLDAFSAFQQQKPNFTELTLQHFVLLGDPTAFPPVKALSQPERVPHPASVCLNQSSVFWAIQHASATTATGYIPAASSCFPLPFEADTVSLIGRHIAPTRLSLMPAVTNTTVFPNPVESGNTIQIATSAPISHVRWVNTNGLTTMANLQEGQSMTAPKAGIWLLEVHLKDGTYHTHKIIVLP